MKILKAISDILKKEKGGGVLKEYCELVCNSIFNQMKIKQIINTYDNNYIMSYSFLGDTHKYLGDWCKHLHLCRFLNRFIEETESTLGEDFCDIDNNLKQLIGEVELIKLDYITEYQMALDNYFKAVQMHKEGAVYRNDMKNMIYLEDDYNDNLYHFGAAIERFKLNSGRIRESIRNVRNSLDLASRYKYKTFISYAEDSSAATDVPK